MNCTSKNKIAQAAEAVLYKEGDTVIKERVSKGYRLSEMDKKITKERTRSESNILVKARRNGVNVPLMKSVDSNKINMEFVEGKQVKEELNKNNYEEIVEKIAKQVTLLHNSGIVHGDLTTSNMILRNDEVVLIDFGLSQNSHKIEDKAVDVYLLKQALESKHHDIADFCFEMFVKKYECKDKQKVMERFRCIEKRRRYMSGH